MTNSEPQITPVFQSKPEEGFVSYTNRATEKVIPAYRTKEYTHEVVGPLFVQDPTVDEMRSVLVLRAMGDHDLSEREILYAAGADVQWFARGSGRPEARVSVYHSFAKDFESSRSSLLSLTISSFQVLSIDGGRTQFEGWVTNAAYYGEGDTGEGDGILELSASDKREEDPERGGDWYANNRYPYLPPSKTDIVGYKLPLRVEGVIYNAGGYDVNKIFRSAAGLPEEAGA